MDPESNSESYYVQDLQERKQSRTDERSIAESYFNPLSRLVRSFNFQDKRTYSVRDRRLSSFSVISSKDITNALSSIPTGLENFEGKSSINIRIISATERSQAQRITLKSLLHYVNSYTYYCRYFLSCYNSFV